LNQVISLLSEREIFFVDASWHECYSLYWIEQARRVNLKEMHTEEEAMSKEQLLQELADAYARARSQLPLILGVMLLP
jgi:hypothetical protein